MKIKNIKGVFLKILFLFIFFIFIFFPGCCDLKDKKPATPSNFKAVKGDFEVIITWDNVPNISYYNLYYTVNERVTKANKIIKIPDATSPYIHKNLSANTYYCYIVTSVKGEYESLASNQICVDFPFTKGIWNNARWDKCIWGK